MQDSSVSSVSGRIFRVAFLGQPVECEHPQHAAAVQQASDIFRGLDATEHGPEVFERLADALERYGHPKAAEALRDRARLARAGSQ